MSEPLTPANGNPVTIDVEMKDEVDVRRQTLPFSS
jgi:hypothetical protein